MKKSIIKTKLTSREQLVSALAGIGFEFSEPYWQHDRIFVPKNYDRAKSQPRLSLRTIVKDASKNATYYLVLRRHLEKENCDLVNVTEVKDYTEAAHILFQLGYELKYEVSRRREELKMGEDVRICIDKIDNLSGYYAKIESNLSDADDHDAALADLAETFKVLGIRTKLVAQTYGELIESEPRVAA